MECTNCKTIIDELKKYHFAAKDNQYITITEWPNQEGWIIDIDNHVFNLHECELNAINFLTSKLQYEK